MFIKLVFYLVLSFIGPIFSRPPRRVYDWVIFATEYLALPWFTGILPPLFIVWPLRDLSWTPLAMGRWILTLDFSVISSLRCDPYSSSTASKTDSLLLLFILFRSEYSRVSYMTSDWVWLIVFRVLPFCWVWFIFFTAFSATKVYELFLLIILAYFRLLIASKSTPMFSFVVLVSLYLGKTWLLLIYSGSGLCTFIGLP